MTSGITSWWAEMGGCTLGGSGTRWAPTPRDTTTNPSPSPSWETTWLLHRQTECWLLHRNSFSVVWIRLVCVCVCVCLSVYNYMTGAPSDRILTAAQELIQCGVNQVSVCVCVFVTAWLLQRNSYSVGWIRVVCVCVCVSACLSGLAPPPQGNPGSATGVCVCLSVCL